MFMESLESRTLMSASAIDSQIAADRLVIKEDFLTFKSDIFAARATIIADLAQLKADDVGQDSTLAPLIKTFHTDARAMHEALLVERLNEGAKVNADEATIVTELIQIQADKGNKTALQADRAQLLTDRIQLQTDEVNGLNNRIATRQADYTTLSNDLQAIATAVDNDSNASAQVMADVNKFVTDRTNILNTLTADLTALSSARSQLITDLEALET
jgi:hypothetical protein